LHCLRFGYTQDETETLFEYSIKPGTELPAELKSLPLQVQVHYTKMNGIKCVRIISQAQPITRSRQTAEAEADVSLLGLHAMKHAAVVAQKGDYSKARLYSANARQVLSHAAKTPQQQAQFVSYARNHTRFEAEIGNLQQDELRAGMYNDSSATAVCTRSFSLCVSFYLTDSCVALNRVRRKPLAIPARPSAMIQAQATSGKQRLSTNARWIASKQYPSAVLCRPLLFLLSTTNKPRYQTTIMALFCGRLNRTCVVLDSQFLY
jgi:hypothetical protein